MPHCNQPNLSKQDLWAPRGVRWAGVGVQKIAPWASNLAGEMASQHSRTTTAPMAYLESMLNKSSYSGWSQTQCLPGSLFAPLLPSKCAQVTMLKCSGPKFVPPFFSLQRIRLDLKPT
eukprot:822667-Pelagomonas_calceolata.AAC.2